MVEKIVGEEQMLVFCFFIRLSKTGRIMGSPVAGGRLGKWALSSSLSGAYLQNYTNSGF